MSVLSLVLGGLNASSVAIFLLVFLVTWYWLTTSRNSPPGPTMFTLVGNLISLRRGGLDILGLLRKWHQQYGDVFSVRLGAVRMVVISSYKMLHEAYVKQGDVFSGRPMNMYVWKEVAKHTGSGLASATGRPWKELRRVTLTALKDFGVGKKSLEQRVQEEARAITEVLKRGQGQPVSLKPLLGKFSANIICSITLGDRYDYDDTFLLRLIAAADYANKIQPIMSAVNFCPMLAIFPQSKKAVNSIIKALLAVDNVLETALKDHEETYDPSEIRDFVDVYIKTRQETKDTKLYCAQNMRRVIVDLLAAGMDTAAATLEWILLYLVAYPNVQKQCQQDVDRVIGQGRQPMMEDLKELPYIHAVISETLRIVNVGPLGLPHMTEGEGKLGGYTVSADTVILINVDEIHHDPGLWPEPYVFKPERFLDKDGQFRLPKEGFVPFSIGPRNCVGESLARMELFIMLTTLVQSFTFTMSQGRKPDLEGHIGIVYSAKSQPVLATLR